MHGVFDVRVETVADAWRMERW